MFVRRRWAPVRGTLSSLYDDDDDDDDDDRTVKKVTVIFHPSGEKPPPNWFAPKYAHMLSFQT